MRLAEYHLAQVLAQLDGRSTPPTVANLADAEGGSLHTARRVVLWGEKLFLINRSSGDGRHPRFQLTNKGRYRLAQWRRGSSTKA